MDIDTLFDNFERSAFRLEALPLYASDVRKESFASFLRSGSLPQNHNENWRNEISAGVARGKSYSRLRLFSTPLTDYERYEQASYALSRAAGEDVRATTRSSHGSASDFWVFDDEWIAYMHYDAEGEFEGTDIHEVSEAEKVMVSSWKRVFAVDAEDPAAFK